MLIPHKGGEYNMTQITKVVIKAGKHEFELSLEEAKGLRDILNSTFSEKQNWTVWRANNITAKETTIYISSPFSEQ
jgi:hypothetical protein